MQKISTSHTETKQKTGSNLKKARYYDAMASHRIGITNNRSSTLGKNTKVAKKKKKKLK